MSLRPLWPYDTVDEASPLVSRFSIAIISSVLLGMTVGYSLPPSVQILTGTAGGIGILFYGYRIWLIRRADKALQEALRSQAESRLERIAPKRSNDRVLRG